MPQSYTPEFQKKIVRLHEEEGRTYKSITAEYGVSKASISKWCSEFSKECQSSPEAKEDYDNMKEMLRLKRENEELRKENLFLKKAAAFFAKEIDQRLIDSSNNIIMNLAFAGCLDGWVYAQMLITTTGNTGRRIIIPLKPKSKHRFRKYIIRTMELTAIGV